MLSKRSFCDSSKCCTRMSVTLWLYLAAACAQADLRPQALPLACKRPVSDTAHMVSNCTVQIMAHAFPCQTTQSSKRVLLVTFSSSVVVMVVFASTSVVVIIVVAIVVVTLESSIIVVVSFVTGVVSVVSSEQPCRKRAKTAIRAARAIARMDFMASEQGSVGQALSALQSA